MVRATEGSNVQIFVTARRYIQKQIEGDYSFPTAQQCVNPSVVTPFYPYSLTANHHVSTDRLATTTNGVNFTDLGAVNELNDSTTVS